MNQKELFEKVRCCRGAWPKPFDYDVENDLFFIQCASTPIGSTYGYLPDDIILAVFEQHLRFWIEKQGYFVTVTDGAYRLWNDREGKYWKFEKELLHDRCCTQNFLDFLIMCVSYIQELNAPKDMPACQYCNTPLYVCQVPGAEYYFLQCIKCGYGLPGRPTKQAAIDFASQKPSGRQ